MATIRRKLTLIDSNRDDIDISKDEDGELVLEQDSETIRVSDDCIESFLSCIREVRDQD